MDSWEKEKMYSVYDVSLMTGWSRDVIRRLIYRGALKAVLLPQLPGRRKRIYRCARVRASDLVEFLKRNEN